MSAEHSGSGTGGWNESLRFDPNGDVMTQAVDLDRRITAGINTGFNETISAERQAEEAHKRLDPLLEASNLARTAGQLEQYATGAITFAELTDDSKQALANGETSATLLVRASDNEKKHHDTKREQGTAMDFDQALSAARQDYIGLLMSRPVIKGRKTHAEQLRIAETAYNDAFIGKIAGILALDPDYAKVPYAAATGRELHVDRPDFKTLSGNHLHVLVDQLAIEQTRKQRDIEKRSGKRTKKVLDAFQNSRLLRYSVGGAIAGGAMLATAKGLLPQEMMPTSIDSAAETAAVSLPMLTGSVAALETAVRGDKFMTNSRKSRKLEKDINTLAESSFLTEAAMRTLYTNLEYQDGILQGRAGGATAEDNKKAFDNVDNVFDSLADENHYRTGSLPYDAKNILPYVTDLYLRRKDQIDAVVAASDPKAAFLQLAREVIVADSETLSGRISKDRKKKVAFVVTSAIVGAGAGPWADAARQTKEVAGLPLAAMSLGAVH